MTDDENEWITFFRHHAPEYMNNPFTGNTDREVEFILDELMVPAEARILDLGCGTGRHAIELAKKGMRMTGVDISGEMLEEARKQAEKEEVQIEWVCMDAIEYEAGPVFDGAICICEGSFGLLGGEDDPYKHEIRILEVIQTALKPGGKLILTALNGFRPARLATPRDLKTGKFDPLTMVETGPMEMETPEGPKSIITRERSFIPSELVLMHELAGLRVEHIYGGTAGAWGRRDLELDEMEIMVISVKTSN
ncbi:MAG: class I SAM-dependent methyltransferase [Anaerolineales bacterium]